MPENYRWITEPRPNDGAALVGGVDRAGRGCASFAAKRRDDPALRNASDETGFHAQGMRPRARLPTTPLKGLPFMPNPIPLLIEDIYVPVKRVKTLEPDKVEALAEDILENGQTTPIRVREGKGRYVLVEGLHRLEALKALGEARVVVYITQARLH